MRLRSAPFDGRAALVRGVVASVARRTSVSAGSVVMATGLVGLALHLDGRGTPASILIGAAAATWLVLALTLSWRGAPAAPARRPLVPARRGHPGGWLR